MISKEKAKKILKDYEDAWINQDINKILSIFTENGIYHEKVLEKPMIGHKEIEEYWRRKVCEEQSNIKFKLLKFYICEDTIIAEWEASFKSNIKKALIHIREIAILEIENNKIKSLREYWQSKKKKID